MNKHEKLPFSLRVGGRGAFPISTYPSLDLHLHTMWMRRSSFILRCCSSSKTCHCSSSRLVNGENKTEGFSPCFRRITAVVFFDEYIAQWERSKSSRLPCQATVETSLHVEKWRWRFLSRPERHDRSDSFGFRLITLARYRISASQRIPSLYSSVVYIRDSKSSFFFDQHTRIQKVKTNEMNSSSRTCSSSHISIDILRRSKLIYHLSTRGRFQIWILIMSFRRMVVCCPFVNVCAESNQSECGYQIYLTRRCKLVVFSSSSSILFECLASVVKNSSIIVYSNNDRSTLHRRSSDGFFSLALPLSWLLSCCSANDSRMDIARAWSYFTSPRFTALTSTFPLLIVTFAQTTSGYSIWWISVREGELLAWVEEFEKVEDIKRLSRADHSWESVYRSMLVCFVSCSCRLHWSADNGLLVCCDIVFLSSSIDVRCPSSWLAIFTCSLSRDFFLVPSSSSRCMIFICWMCAKERKGLCVFVCCRLFAQLCLLARSLVLRRDAFIFVLSLKNEWVWQGRRHERRRLRE